MKHDVVAFCKNHSGFILERWWRGFNEVEEPVSPGLEVSAMLNVLGRPETLRGNVVSLVEQGMNASNTIGLFFSAFEVFMDFLFSRSAFVFRTTLQLYRPGWDRLPIRALQLRADFRR